MKLIPILISLSLFSLFAIGQEPALPEILVPSEYARVEAARQNVQVFKLLPRGTFDQPMTTYGDADNPLGIRGGGAYYSFTTQLHSYNKVPQIELQRGEFSVGFYGANYGMISQLGRFPFSDISSETPEQSFLTSYMPPKLEKDIRAEAVSFHDRRIDGLHFRRSRIPAVLGHSYLLRAISFGEADILVGFNVIEIGDDGSVTILWKKLADFRKPVLLYVLDSELEAAADKIIAENGWFKGLRVEVKDNIFELYGNVNQQELSAFQKAAQAGGLRFRGYFTKSLPVLPTNR